MPAGLTPGDLRSIRCPHCGNAVQVAMEGGPHQLQCFSCKSMIDLDIVHNGQRWTVRRIRGARAST
jgi:DNA-directed RNA polymerase subunit RPC12/RpoP